LLSVCSAKLHPRQKVISSWQNPSTKLYSSHWRALFMWWQMQNKIRVYLEWASRSRPFCLNIYPHIHRTSSDADFASFFMQKPHFMKRAASADVSRCGAQCVWVIMIGNTQKYADTDTNGIQGMGSEIASAVGWKASEGKAETFMCGNSSGYFT